MDKAKAAVSNFLSKDGKHQTTVHETVNPAIQNEKVTRTEHENATKVIDREVHQDHYHTSVQPIQHQEVLPEQHHHNMVGVEHRELQHGNEDHVRQRLEAERAQFKDTRQVGEVQRTSTTVPTVAGEHIHHHVHETIQPVIQKETIQPTVVHTTIPVHEVHHNEAKHHAASALPPVSMADFKSHGGVLGGRDERTDAFEGEPRAVGSTLGGANNHTLGGPGAAGTTSVTNGHHHQNGTTTAEGIKGPHTSRVANAADPRVNSDRDGSRRAGETTTGTGTTGMNGSSARGNGLTASSTRATPGMTGSSTGMSGATTTKKPSLMDKLNPKIDSNGDGKAGFMK